MRQPAFSADVPTTRTQPSLRSTEPTFEVEAGMDGEIFPVFANYASLLRPQDRQFGVIAVNVSNATSAPLRSRVSVVVKGWSDQEIQIAELGAGASRTLNFAPTFLPRFYKNNEIAAATALIRATDMGGKLLFESTVPVRLRSAEDMFWGKQFKYSPFIASWVTPHDVNVERVLAAAKEFMPGRRLAGYEPWKSPAEQEAATQQQTKALYRALQKSGVSYVKSSTTFGKHQAVSQRIRMPKQTLTNRSGNCIDSVVTFASLLENLNLESVVVVVPGHAYVGVKLSRNGSKVLFIDTALVGRASFERAVASAEKGLAAQHAEKVLRVDVSDSRRAGIYPMPQ